jgi:tRNA (guanine26-N2/guanine27-N2)-dimethyltransferase
MTPDPPVWHREGKAHFQIGPAFYRPHSCTARELGLLAAAVHRAATGELRVLDGMTGCGVRALRYVLEGNADWVWANDANPAIGPVLAQNLQQLSSHQFQITHHSAHWVLADAQQRHDYFDLVDLDCFGSPAPYFHACLGATRLGGLIYLTSTDGRTTSGHAPEQSLRHYGAYARAHPAAHEQGLRLIIGNLLQQASCQGRGIEPVFAFFSGQIERVMVRLVARATWSTEQLGFLGYCHACGHYQTVDWRHLSRATCLHHDPALPLTLSGPLWLGPLHNRGFVEQMAAQAQIWNWPQRSRLLQIMGAEAELPPYFFTLGEIGRRAKIDIPQRDRLIQTLQDRGYRASPTHINAQALKTDATFQECLAIAHQLR